MTKFETEALNFYQTLRRRDEAAAFCNHLMSKFPEECKYMDRVEFFICWVTRALGSIPPKDECDRSMRDLLADIHDSLICTRDVTFAGSLNCPFALFRRSLETLILMYYFLIEPQQAIRWRNRDKQIDADEIRKFFKRHPDPKEKWTLDLFKVWDKYSSGAHIHAKYIWGRKLGEGLNFTLGIRSNALDSPMLGMVSCSHLMDLILIFSLAKNISFDFFKRDLKVLEPEIATYYDNNLSDEWTNEIRDRLRDEFLRHRKVLPHKGANVPGFIAIH